MTFQPHKFIGDELSKALTKIAAVCPEYVSSEMIDGIRDQLIWRAMDAEQNDEISNRAFHNYRDNLTIKIIPLAELTKMEAA